MELNTDKITPQMEKEYQAGTLYGFLSSNPNMGLLHLQEAQICEFLTEKTGKRVTQKQRGVIVWE